MEDKVKSSLVLWPNRFGGLKAVEGVRWTGKGKTARPICRACKMD